MKIHNIDISLIDSNSKNPKDHNDKAILRSVQTFGIRQPIIVAPDDKGRFVIVAGHGRLDAYKKIGTEDIPCIVWNESDKDKINAFMVADNQTTIAGGWDHDGLSELLKQIVNDTDIDTDVFGFTDEELQDLLGDDEPTGGDPGEAPPVPEDPLSKTGDLWTLGLHRLLCGDIREGENRLRLLDGKTPDMVFTDPPYGIDYKDLKNNFDKITGDTYDEVGDLIKESFVKGIPNYICCNWQSYPHFFHILRNHIDFKAAIVWDKVNAAQHLDKFYKQHEFIIYSGPFGGQKTLSGDIWTVKRQTSTLHPTMKPVELIATAIKYSSRKGDIVLDVFGGSGTTLIAAEQLDRICYMMEIDPKYCDVILQRYFNLTNISPVREDGVAWTSLKKNADSN